MGFFKDFKRDFAQAVNELMPDKDELAGEYDDEDMVNTFDENDNMEIAPEDMLEDIDDYGEYNEEEEDRMKNYRDDVDDDDTVGYAPVEFDKPSEDTTKKDNLDDVPEAELISEHDFNDLSSLNELENQENTSDEAGDKPSETKDELKSADSLDETNMLEGVEDASRLDAGEAAPEENYYGNPFEQMGEEQTELPDMDLLKDIEEVLTKVEASSATAQVSETESQEEEKSENNEDEYAAGGFPEADQFREDVMAEVEMNSHATDTTKSIDDILEVDTTYITKSTTIRGNIKTEGSVDVLGTVKGNVSCTGKLIIGGTIKGDVDAGDIYANAAKIEGKVLAEGSVKIGVGSIVMGDVLATSAVIAGAVNGDIDVHGPVIVDSTAVVMGNIKSRSVQINNGAVIEGFCSQCYSEIDVKSFFDMEEDDDDDEEDEIDKDVETNSKPDNKQSGKSGNSGNGRKNSRKKNNNNNNSSVNSKNEQADAEPAAETVTEDKEAKDE